jgi:hypothetical protein
MVGVCGLAAGEAEVRMRTCSQTAVGGLGACRHAQSCTVAGGLVAYVSACSRKTTGDLASGEIAIAWNR